tara:strand:+ start:45 stop:734 length:690 start_codon:yes stop_codon:yes gene_type:complete
MLNLIKIISLIEDHRKENSDKLTTVHLLALSYIASINSDDDFFTKDLEKALHLCQAKTHRICTSLKVSGLVNVDVYKLDGRHRVLSLTSKGHTLAQDIQGLMSEKSSTSLKAEVQSLCQKTKIRSDIKKELLKAKGSLHLRKEEVREALGNKGETLIEVGCNYIKTIRGIVTLPVLLKRASASSVDDLVRVIKSKPLKDYDAFFTPTPKYKPTWQREAELQIELRKAEG